MNAPEELTLGDVADLAAFALPLHEAGIPKVQMDSAHAVSLIMLATKAHEQAALIASQAARIRELEEGVRPLSLAASLMSGDPDDRVVSVGRWYDYDDGNPPRFGADVQLTVGHFRRARSLLSRKGGE